MDSRGLYYITGTIVLMLFLTGCCTKVVNSETVPPFRGLECTCGKNCTYGIQKCELIRCKCPYQEGDYDANVNCSDEVCPENCCELIPVSFANVTATHFMHSEKYQNFNESESARVVIIFTKLNGSETARWVATLVKEQSIDEDDDDDKEEQVPKNVFISEAAITTDMGVFLDHEDEIPEALRNKLTNLETSKGFSEPLSCNAMLNTRCDEEFCSCLIFPEDRPLPVVESFRNITEGTIVYDIGNNLSTLETSSSLAPFHSIDVKERSSCSLAGWAPSFNDTDPWVQFSNIQWDVCGVVIQGAAWSGFRRLEKFEVVADNETVKSLNGVDHFQSGVVLYSKSIHLFSLPAREPKSLRINVVEPTDPLKVGFRASLITCGSAVVNCTDDGLVEGLKDKIDQVINMAESGEIPLGDPIGLVSVFYHQIQEFLAGNFDKYASGEEGRYQYTIGNVEMEVYVVKIEDLKKEGYIFSNSLLDSPSSFHFISVIIPPDGIVSENDENAEVVVLTSVAHHNDSEEHTDVDDDDRFRYILKSPIVTIRIFINGSECEKVIKDIKVTIQHEMITEGDPNPKYFEEECVNRSNGKHVHWSTEGCKSLCDEAKSTCEMKCTHATSFAVLQLVGKSQLSEAGKLAASILTTIGCVISIISLVAALIIYFLLRSSIATAQYAIHTNLMVSLLISLCVFMTLMIPKKSEVVCKATMFLLQYFFSAAFCWMLCEGIHLYRQIITVFESGSKYIQIYFIVGWALPLSFVVVSMFGIFMQESRTRNDCCESRSKPCFFSHEDGSIWYFLVPVLVVIVINTGILARVTIVVIRAAKLQAEKDSSQALYQAKAGLRSALLLIPLLGCSYCLGFLSSIHGVFEIIYNIINSLQGFFLALFYCVMNKEVRAAIGTYIRRSRDMSTIQASTTGSTVPKFYPEVSKRKHSKRNQVEPAEEPLEESTLEDVD